MRERRTTSSGRCHWSRRAGTATNNALGGGRAASARQGLSAAAHPSQRGRGLLPPGRTGRGAGRRRSIGRCRTRARSCGCRRVRAARLHRQRRRAVHVLATPRPQASTGSWQRWVPRKPPRTACRSRTSPTSRDCSRSQDGTGSSPASTHALTGRDESWIPSRQGRGSVKATRGRDLPADNEPSRPKLVEVDVQQATALSDSWRTVPRPTRTEGSALCRPVDESVAAVPAALARRACRAARSTGVDDDRCADVVPSR